MSDVLDPDNDGGLPEPPPADGPGLFGDAPAPVSAAAPLAAAPPTPAAPAAPREPYRVLARAYRPTRFDELIGQDATVRILRRAFAVGRVAHAFMLTGVRGTGKTTTARIIARALNCIGPDGNGGPTADPCGVCANCRAILSDRHPDVLEMDAASRTGIDDVREIIEATRFRPMQARMKVFIVDEVHMLSKPAFNALLKTLEEPPREVTFVFATTELRKVPVTVLSRCQRFDLRRVGQGELSAHFGRIAEREGVAIEPEALALIARAADGSVRDGLSLLDQAIAQGADDGANDGADEGADAGGGAVGAPRAIRADRVADMLGLADRGLLFDLLDAVMDGRPADALAITDRAHERGADLGTVLADLLELLHTISRLKAIPNLRASAELPEFERARGGALADALSVPALGRAWQMLLKGVAEVDQAPDRRAAAEMALIRLCHVAELPTPGELVRQLNGGAPVLPPGRPAPSTGGGASFNGAMGNNATGNGTTASVADHPTTGNGGAAPAPRALRASGGVALHAVPRAVPVEPAAAAEPEPVPANPNPVAPVPAPDPAPAIPDPGQPPPPPVLRSWREVVAFVATRREATLHGHLRHCAHLVRFAPPVIELRLEKEAPRDLSQRLAATLSEGTGTRWTIVLGQAPGEPTLAEQAEALDADISREAADHPLVRAILSAFPGARLGPVRDEALDEYGLPPEPEPPPSLLEPELPPELEFAPDDAEPAGPEDLGD
ncbi:MAG: DNA polymerase III subunit gamma/tau [Gluconacetobacter diazotrophicus]|nr:DNA polymerase III subunit gamma/tau [Gluconacetobacter diazotrophicus]